MDVAIIGAVFIVLIFVSIHFHFKTIDRIKADVEKKGHYFLRLEDADPFSRRNRNYWLYYRDTRKNFHQAKVRIDFSSYEIVSDKIITEVPERILNDLPEGEYTPYKKPLEEKAVISRKKFDTPDGYLVVELTEPDIAVGNKVLLDDKKAPDGKYKLGFLTYIYVKDGNIC